MNNIDKKQSFDYALIAMAYHESGHAIVSLYNYMYVFNVNVMTTKRKDGNTEFFVYGNDDIKDKELKNILLTAELQAMYAGLIAEKVYYKDICGSSKFPMNLKKGSYYDIAQASSIIRKNDLSAPGKKTFQFKKKIQNQCELIINENWDAIKVVAHSLYQRKRLGFDELKYLLLRRTENKELWKDKFSKIKLIHSMNSPSEEEVKNIYLSLF